jgi:hypothetical protein
MPHAHKQRVKGVDDPIERLLPPRRRQPDQLGEHRDVAAGAEMRAGAAQQHEAGGAILGRLGDGGGELGDHLAVHRVEDFRPVQGNLKDPLVSLDDNARHRVAPDALRSIMPGASAETIP